MLLASKIEITRNDDGAFVVITHYHDISSTSEVRIYASSSKEIPAKVANAIKYDLSILTSK